MTYSISYGLNFAAITGMHILFRIAVQRPPTDQCRTSICAAILVHTYLYNGAEIWAKVRLLNCQLAS